MSCKGKCGIVGLPNVGKSTLFNFFMKEEVAKVANYPFCTIEPNIKKREVKDKRLEFLAAKMKSEKIIYANLEIYDIAGLVKGASDGEGLGNKFLGNILEVDLIIHVVRLFKGTNEMESNTLDPISDFEIIEAELFLWDMKRVEDAKNKRNEKERKTLEDTLASLNEGKRVACSSLPLITSKPVIVLGNGNDEVLSSSMKEFCKTKALPFFNFDFHDKQDSNFDELLIQAYKTLNLISFFTCGPKETRAWTIKNGTTYKEAAAEIHNDIKNGFICAQVVNWQEFHIKSPVMKKANDIVQDGDVILFKHH